MSAPYLLDVNVLIALVIDEHEHHRLAAEWAAGVARVALCPIVEGGLIRFLVRMGERVQTATTILDALYGSRRCEFWEDSLSYRAVDLSHVHGHRQVTDAYLASLALARGGYLASFDAALANARPDAVSLIS